MAMNNYFIVLLISSFSWVKCNIALNLLVDDQLALEPDENCTVYRDNLANAISNFTSCAIKHSRPITLCESCVDAYLNIQACYQNLSHTKSGDGFCIDDYVNLDRLQIVEGLYKNSLKLWNQAKCYECFEIVNNTMTHNPSEETQMFVELLNDTLQCINETDNNETLFCTLCMDDYLGLDSYYISISNINEKIGMCMDIVDLMNGTRTMWSKRCCEYRKKHEYIFLGSTALAIFITILFYIMTKFCADLKKPGIIRQNRLAESLSNTN